MQNCCLLWYHEEIRTNKETKSIEQKTYKTKTKNNIDFSKIKFELIKKEVATNHCKKYTKKHQWFNIKH